MTDIQVNETEHQLSEKKQRASKGKPSHWANASATLFHNPWPSWRYHTTGEQISLFPSVVMNHPSVPKNIDTLIKTRKPDWGVSNVDDDAQKIKTTWLGHACFLVELPHSPSLQRGARILFDPVFSDRCSPVQFIGPKRYTPIPCPIADIPDVDAVVISHNHYDHLDTHTITELFKRRRPPHVFAPLGNLEYFQQLKIPANRTHILDWWDARRVEVDIPVKNGNNGKEGKEEKGVKTEKVAFDITCTPGQHFTGRGIRDRFKSLWAGWAVEEVKNADSETASTSNGAKVYFAGDTGYRSVKDGQDEDTVPTCPAFKEIGEKFGGFDLALLPIGAYLPRQFMSPIHCAPQDSVRIFQDIRAKRALGMHWGTWILTTEDVTEPPKRLAEECKKVGIEDGAFTVCEIGETVFF